MVAVGLGGRSPPLLPSTLLPRPGTLLSSAPIRNVQRNPSVCIDITIKLKENSIGSRCKANCSKVYSYSFDLRVESNFVYNFGDDVRSKV